MKSPRSVDRRYEDPLNLIWLQTAARLGMTVLRSSEVFASWDGTGTLTLGQDDDLDPDDCIAQMVFHELCHALVEGENAHTKPDWGLENIDDRHAAREYAALRLQAALLTPHGLRQILAVTTDWRAHYDALPTDPLTGEGEDVILALAGWQRATAGPWAEPLQQALRATALIARATAPFATSESLWKHTSGEMSG